MFANFSGQLTGSKDMTVSSCPDNRSLFTSIDQNLLEKIVATVDGPGESTNLRALSGVSKFFWKGLREVRQQRQQRTAERHLDLLIQGCRRCEIQCSRQCLFSCLQGRERNVGDYGIETADAVAGYLSCLAQFPLPPRSRRQLRYASVAMMGVGQFLRGSAVLMAAQPVVAALILPAAIAWKSSTMGLHGAVVDTITTYALFVAVGLASMAAVTAAIQPLAVYLRRQEAFYGLAVEYVDLDDTRRCLRTFLGAMHGASTISAAVASKRIEALSMVDRISRRYGLVEASAALRQLQLQSGPPAPSRAP